MRARALAVSNPSRLYFAYSTILDRSAFEIWRSQHAYEFFTPPTGEIAEATDVDLAFDFPSRFWGGLVTGLVDQPGSSVHGRVFEIAGIDWPIIQHKEGWLTGMSVERQVSLRVGDRVLLATAFATNPERRRTDGAVSRAFCEALVRGAISAGLPPAWIAELERRSR